MVNDLYIQQDGAGEGDNSNTSQPARKRIKLPKTMGSYKSKSKSKTFNNIASKQSLNMFRLQRLEDSRQDIYIPLMAKANFQSRHNDIFPLVDKVHEFLAGKCEVMLILGDSGGGKSTFNLQVEHTLWKSYKSGDPIPLHINLPSIENPQHDMIYKRLRQLQFTDAQIMELKQKRQFILLCDGYDEIQLTSNIHTSNHFNQPGHGKSRWLSHAAPSISALIIAIALRHREAEAVIAPFTDEQIQSYIDIYVSLEPRIWDTKEYMKRLNKIPNLMDLVKNPFLLSLALEALPEVSKGKQNLLTIKVTRVQIYDTFIQHWLEVNQRRLERNNDMLSSEDRSTLVHLLDAGFVSLGIEYLTNLAQAIFDKQDGIPVVQYVHIKEKNT
ncbi:hypothetical protein EC991_010371 [Linnemannia zychae]|nr:hypothetical protein EC991_010371 [Linnemannia zychae]